MEVFDLTTNEKIGQMFMFGINNKDITPLYSLIREYKIGGVILYKKNYSSYQEMIDIINKLKDANKENKIPLFIAIDQEGGRVNRLPNEIHNIKNIYDLSSLNDINILKKSVDIISYILSNSGINMNFSPVLDIYNGIENGVLYKRCFSSDIDVVSNYGVSYMKKLQDNNIISVIKHFPGHGMSRKDSHVFVPVVHNKELYDNHVKPFLDAINNSCDALMLGHIVVKGITYGVPASISKRFIKDYIRDKYNYNGLVITDDIRMMALSFYRFNILDRVFNSGSDIVLFKYKKNDYKIINKVVDMYNNKKIDNELINNSVDRIIKIKEKYNINDNKVNNIIDIDLINKEIDELNSKFK